MHKKATEPPKKQRYGHACKSCLKKLTLNVAISFSCFDYCSVLLHLAYYRNLKHSRQNWLFNSNLKKQLQLSIYSEFRMENQTFPVTRTLNLLVTIPSRYLAMTFPFHQFLGLSDIFHLNLTNRLFSGCTKKQRNHQKSNGTGMLASLAWKNLL